MIILALLVVPCQAAQVDLTWTLHEGAAWYTIYWYADGGELGQISVPGPPFTISVPGVGVIYIGITAHDARGNLLGSSDEVSIEFTGPEVLT